MKIETKFEIGQEAWPIHRVCTRYTGDSSVWVLVDSIPYSPLCVYRESDLFPTREQAEVECARRSEAEK